MTEPHDDEDAEDIARRERMAALQRAWYQANRDRILEEKRLRYQTDPDFRARALARSKKRDKRGSWLRRYGLSRADFDRMLARQHGLCLLCWKPFKRTPHIDHDHTAWFVRALLCTNCNIGFGNFFEDPAVLRRAADFSEFFAARRKEILRGDPAAVKEATRLKAALLEVDISSLLPPKELLPSLLAAAAEPTPSKATAIATQPAKPRRGKRAQPRPDRRRQGRSHHTAGDSPRAAPSLRSAPGAPRRQTAAGRAQPRRQAGC